MHNVDTQQWVKIHLSLSMTVFLIRTNSYQICCQLLGTILSAFFFWNIAAVLIPPVLRNSNVLFRVAPRLSLQENLVQDFVG